MSWKRCWSTATSLIKFVMIKIIHNDTWVTFAQLSAKLDTEVQLKLRAEEFKIHEELMDSLRKICTEERRALERMKRESRMMRKELDRIQKRTPSLVSKQLKFVRGCPEIASSAKTPNSADAETVISSIAPSSFDLKEISNAVETLDETSESGFWSSESVSTDDCTLPTTNTLPVKNELLQRRGDNMGIRNHPGRHTNRLAYTFRDDDETGGNQKPTYAEQRSQIRMLKAKKLCDTIEQLRQKRKKLMYPNFKTAPTNLESEPRKPETKEDNVYPVIFRGTRKLTIHVQPKRPKYKPGRRVSKLCGNHLKRSDQ